LKKKTSSFPLVDRITQHPWRWALVALVVIGAAIAALSLLPVKEWIDSLESWVDEHGRFGRVAFAIAYVLGALLLVPEWMFTVIAGALFGMLWGFALAWCAALTASMIAFFVARSALRERVRRWIIRDRKIDAVDKALREDGWKTVALMRMSPLVPFGIQNYLLGASRVKVKDYALGTALAIAPGTLVYIFLGSTGRALASDTGPATWAMLAAGLLASVAFSWRIGKIAKKKLGVS